MKSDETVWRDVATRQHGAVSHAQLSLSSRQIRWRVGAGELVRVFPSVYRVGGAPETFEHRVVAATLASGGVASHRCAAALWGLRGCEPRWVEVLVANRRRPELPGVVSHARPVWTTWM